MALSTGIAELDDILHGGYLSGRTTLIIGGPGSGKTMLGLQFLADGAGSGEPGLMITFEESADRLKADFGSMSFAFADTIGSTVHVIDARPPEDMTAIGSFDLHGLIASLTGLIEQTGARRIVFDALDMLFALTGDSILKRQEVMRLLNWLERSNMTAILTMKSQGSHAELAEYFEFTEFAADCVLQLRSSVHLKLLQQTLRVVKMRGSSFITGDHPYTIGARGIRVLHTPIRTMAAQSNIQSRASSGVDRLDRMIEGGYVRGSITLISGLPGTSKTTFGAAFLAEGCAAGERGLFVGFDEPAEQMLGNVRSVGIDLTPCIESGHLRMESLAAGAAIADRLLLMVNDLIDEHQPRRVVIDPISAWTKSGGSEISDIAVERLVALIKSRGLTAIFTAVSDSGTTAVESTSTRISTIADTWIHLSYAIKGGERNRTLTIVKSRGTDHSAQVREVILGQAGISLADVYVGDGEVLFGTARFEREQQLGLHRTEQARAHARELQLLEEERNVLVNEGAQIQRDLARIELQHAVLAERSAIDLQDQRDEVRELGVRRGADPEHE